MSARDGAAVELWGLTGGIACGKSTVSRLLAARGAVVIDADLLAREVVQKGSEGLRALVERFGDELDDGTRIIPVVLSRGDLANLVGTTVETTIRAMSRWLKAGIVETTDEGFVVRRNDELEAIARGA